MRPEARPAAGDGHALLLSAGQRGYRALLKSVEVDHVEHLHDTVMDLLLRQFDLALGLRVHLGDAQTKGDIFKYI